MYQADITTLSIPEKNLMLLLLQLDETQLNDKIVALNLPCEQVIGDLAPNLTLSDGMVKTLKNEFILWQMWADYNNPDFIEKSSKARSDFMYFIETVRDNKYKQQMLSNQNDSIKTKGILVFNEPIL